MTPVQKDAFLFVGWMAALVVSVWVAVSYGVRFSGPSPGIDAWAAALLLLVGGLGTALTVSWWYYVYADERTPARGEFTLERDGSRFGRVRKGFGSFRTKLPGTGTQEEAEYRMTTEEGFVPRTRLRWLAWFVLIGLALVVSGGLAAYARTAEDPLAPMLAAVALMGGAVMLGALAVGEFGHEGPWARRRERA
jgi:hypothetical protein